MKKFTKIIALMMVAALALTCFASCSDTQQNAETTAAPSDNTTSAAQAVSATLTDGVLTVGTNAAFPPFEYVGADGSPDGFDIALIKAIGEVIGVEVVVQDMEFNSLVESVGTKIDAAIAGMTVKPERDEVVDFSVPYYTATQYVLAAKGDDTIKSIDDLNGKVIGAQLGTTGQYAAEDEIEAKEVKTYDKAVDAVNDLVNGRLDAVVIDKNPALVFEAQYDSIAVVGTDYFAPEEYAIALPEGDIALKTAVDDAIATLKENGKFDSLVKEYIEAE